MKRRALILPMALLALVAASCGQYADVHGRLAQGSSGRAGGISPGGEQSPVVLDPGQSNGENSGPSAPTTAYTSFRIVTVTRTRKRVKLPQVPVIGRGPFQLCPVQGRGSYGNDWHAPRYAGGFHLHQGNDIFAAAGTPIVAPFDGRAVATPNLLGGASVTVYGAMGYVYNAHLSGYGKLGPVKAGDVVGYVGNSGDALGGPTHDHFEWHPNNGPAVNPYPYLVLVCH